MPTYLLVTRSPGPDPLDLRRMIEACCPRVRWLQEPAQTADDESVDLFEASALDAHQITDLLREAHLDSDVWPAPRWLSVREMLDDLEHRAETD